MSSIFQDKRVHRQTTLQSSPNCSKNIEKNDSVQIKNCSHEMSASKESGTIPDLQIENIGSKEEAPELTSRT